MFSIVFCFVLFGSVLFCFVLFCFVVLAHEAVRSVSEGGEKDG